MTIINNGENDHDMIFCENSVLNAVIWHRHINLFKFHWFQFDKCNLKKNIPTNDSDDNMNHTNRFKSPTVNNEYICVYFA